MKDKFSQGCHHLIRKNIALLTEGADDIVLVTGWDKDKMGESENTRQQALFYALTDPEKKVVDAIQDAEEIGVDQLSYLTKLGNSELASLLLNLEFQGVVRSLPGKRYVLT